RPRAAAATITALATLASLATTTLDHAVQSVTAITPALVASHPQQIELADQISEDDCAIAGHKRPLPMFLEERCPSQTLPQTLPLIAGQQSTSGHNGYRLYIAHALDVVVPWRAITFARNHLPAMNSEAGFAVVSHVAEDPNCVGILSG